MSEQGLTPKQIFPDLLPGENFRRIAPSPALVGITVIGHRPTRAADFSDLVEIQDGGIGPEAVGEQCEAPHQRHPPSLTHTRGSIRKLKLRKEPWGELSGVGGAVIQFDRLGPFFVVFQRAEAPLYPDLVSHRNPLVVPIRGLRGMNYQEKPETSWNQIDSCGGGDSSDRRHRAHIFGAAVFAHLGGMNG